MKLAKETQLPAPNSHAGRASSKREADAPSQRPPPAQGEGRAKARRPRDGARNLGMGRGAKTCVVGRRRESQGELDPQTVNRELPRG